MQLETIVTIIQHNTTHEFTNTYIISNKKMDCNPKNSMPLLFISHFYFDLYYLSMRMCTCIHVHFCDHVHVFVRSRDQCCDLSLLVHCVHSGSPQGGLWVEGTGVDHDHFLNQTSVQESVQVGIHRFLSGVVQAAATTRALSGSG